MNIFSFAERHAKAVIFGIALLIIAGIYASINLPVAIFPNIDFPRIVVIVDNGEQPAQQVMITLTKPLEEAIRAVPGVRDVRSTTARGSAEISINFDWGTDVIQAQQLLLAQISSIRNQLPSSANIDVERMNATFFPIMGYEITSDTHSQVELKDLALYTIRPILSRIKGISQVVVVGGRTREFLVTVDPLKLASYHLSIQQVSDAIKNTNIVSSVGYMDENYHLYLTLVDDMYKTIDDIDNTVISTQGSTPIYLKEVASVKPSVKDEYIRVTGNGKQAVLINVVRQPDGNTVQIAKDVKTALENLKSQIPSGITIRNYYDQSDLVIGSFESVRDSIGIGILFAVIVLLIFLRNWRVTFVAAIIIPATVSITAALLMVTNQTLNMMTLGGIAAAIGLIIDDTIVIIENVFRHFGHGHERVSQAISASIKEMLPAVIGSSSSTIIIFLPFAFLSGVTGAFFRSLSLTMALALIVSLLLSLLLAPLLASKIIHVKDFQKEAKSESSGRILSLYKTFLKFLVERRWIVLPVILLISLSSYYIYSHLGSEFMPKMDEGAFVMDYVAPFGTSLNETNRMLMHVEKIIMSIPEVDTYSRRTGTQMGFFITEPNTGDYLIKLKKNRNRNIDEIMNELRQKVEASEPALQIDFGQAMQDLIGDLTSVPSPIEIKVFGENKEIIQTEAEKIAELIKNVRGVVDVYNGVTISGPAFIIKVNQRAAGRAGFTVSDLQQIIYNYVHGDISTSVQSGEKLIGVRIRYPDKYRDNIEQLKSVRIISPNGGSYLLGSLANITVDPGQSEIDRENLKQMVAVTARISGRDLGSTIGAIKSELKKELVLPNGVTISYGGIYKTQQESFYGLLMVLLAASLLVILVLIIEFESFFLPLAIYLVALLSLFGVFLALWITDISFNISSFMGAIMMVGIVAENSIFLVHYFLKFQKEGMPLKEAIIEAGAVRFRPIIMTALAAILALMPLALGIGAGAQMQQPLAISVIGGFSLSSLLLLFVLPVLIAKYKR